MISVGCTIILAAALLWAGTSGAEEPTSPQSKFRNGLSAEHAKDWAQARLTLDPALREQIGRTKSFLDQNATGLDSEVFRLKDQGILDRRRASKIRTALHHAQSAVAQISDSIDANEQIDGWTARMASYELGLAADSLAKQADAIEKAVGSDGEKPATLANTLKESSKLSKETARAIVSHLK